MRPTTTFAPPTPRTATKASTSASTPPEDSRSAPTPTARAAPEILPPSRSSTSKNLTFKPSKSTIPATP